MNQPSNRSTIIVIVLQYHQDRPLINHPKFPIGVCWSLIVLHSAGGAGPDHPDVSSLADCDKLKRYAGAAADWERAIELDTGQRRQFLRRRLGFSLARAGDHVRAAREAKALAKAAKEKGSALYSVARIYSLSAAVAAQDKSLEQTKRSKLADEYALYAIDLLKRAQAAGFFKATAKVEQMKKDADLDSLRMRADFKKLLSELQENN